MTIEELFGTLQMSVVAGWRKHLRSAKYGKHMALDEFYKEMPDKVDDLIEAWMGAHGKKVGNFTNILTSSNLNTLKYLTELKRVCKEGRTLMGGNDELNSLLDDIINLINTTLYKVKELSESEIMDLKDFINEALVNEAKDPGQAIKDMYEDDGDLVSVASCWHWLDELDWALMSDTEYVSAINDINDSIGKSLIRQRYLKALKAMQKMARENAYNYIKNMVDDESELDDFSIEL